MDTHTLHQKYLSAGTPGHAIIRRFHAKYGDVLARANLTVIDDIVHEVLLSLSKSDLSQVQNVEHYVMRAIKLHCWSILDKALRLTSVIAERGVDAANEDEHGERGLRGPAQQSHGEIVEGMELLAYVNLFKAGLKQRDVQLLNLLIDETERSEIARLLELNLNTLDTSIRRLRMRLAEFLRNLGYTYTALERFVQN